MSRRAERTARPDAPLDVEPARPRPAGADGAAPDAGARPHGRSAGSAAARAPSHRPVEALTAADTAPAAPLDRGDKASAAGAVAASNLAGATTEGGALDLHEGICDPAADGCARWPEHLRLLNESTGELVRGRCRATNLCVYCQRLYVVETVEMLTLDALEYAPTLWLVLTAREHLTRTDTYSHLRQLRKAARLRWPEVEWFVQVEFQRRGALHLNLLVKGVAAADLEPFSALASSLWCARVDALPVAQWADVVNDGYGVTRYISKMLAHGLKAEQAPPPGWRGHRTSQTRGYLVRPARVMRQEARRSLQEKRALWRVRNARPDADAWTLEALVVHEVAMADRQTWSLARVEKVRAALRWKDTGRKVVASG